MTTAAESVAASVRRNTINTKHTDPLSCSFFGICVQLSQKERQGEEGSQNEESENNPRTHRDFKAPPWIDRNIISFWDIQIKLIQQGVKSNTYRPNYQEDDRKHHSNHSGFQQMFGPSVHRLAHPSLLLFYSIKLYFLHYAYIVLYTILTINTKNNNYFDLNA